MARKSGAKGQRKNTRKFVTVEVQGPASWVEFRIPTWKQSREAIKHVREDARKYIQRDVGRDRDVVLRPTADFEVDEVEAALVDMLWQLAVEQFVDWNWVDDNGELLPPLPEIDLGDLLGPEVQKIMKIMQSLFGISEDDEGKV
jgi:hypothetical protein